MNGLLTGSCKRAVILDQPVLGGAERMLGGAETVSVKIIRLHVEAVEQPEHNIFLRKANPGLVVAYRAA
ncbi:hypothetical protein SDC9_172925 [bioreactor metagenome]|uniref:Uncharacterized protein n=1 Tax=bioreactor metagenome TaxID=1076179 RepID=A0A645GNH6_9ZZZZ